MNYSVGISKFSISDILPIVQVLMIAGVLLPATSLKGQDYLIPEKGIHGGLSDYNITLDHVFREGYSNNVRLRTLIIPSFGREYMVGLTRGSAGYKLFSIVPDSSIWGSSWKAIPCSESHDTETISRDDESKSCEGLDFNRSSSIQAEAVYVPIDTLKAQLLQDLWQEMLLESRYPNDNLLVMDGVSYHFSAWVFGHGTISAYTHSPPENSRPHKLVQIGNQIYDITSTESAELRDPMIDSLYLSSKALMKEVLENGNKLPIRNGSPRILSGCDADMNNRFQNSYCWQMEVDNDEFSELLIASEEGNSYSFRLVDFYTSNEFRSVPILPVVNLFAQYANKGQNTTRMEAEYFVLKPWEILDIVSLRINGITELYGYRDYTISDSPVDGDLHMMPDKRILFFDAVRSRRGYTENIRFEGDGTWFSLDDLFQTD